MRVSYKRAAVKDMEATRDYIAGQLILIWARHWQKSLKSPQMCAISWCQSS
mgnify:CR=1 FL=1